MKKCKKCGALQSDDRSVCLDCGTLLGRPMTEAEEAAEEDVLDDRLEAMAERTEDFYVPLRDKIMGIICIIGIVAAFVLMGIAGGEKAEPTEELFLGAIVSIIFLAFACPMLLFPRFVWNLSTWRYRYFYDWDTTPSENALIFRKLATYLLFAMGIIALFVSWFCYL